MYKFAVENFNKPEAPKLLFVPILSEIENASKILTAAGQKYQGGVPLYAVSVGKDKEQYVMIQMGNKQRMPFFFEKKQAEAAADGFKKNNANLSSTVKIEVITSLEGLVGELQKTDDKNLSSLILWPSEESSKYIETVIQNQTKQAPAQGSPKTPAPGNTKPSTPPNKK